MISDQELLQRYIRTRDGQAFAELAQRYAPMVYGICLRTAGNQADAEDAAQETLLQLARMPEAVRSSLGGWLYCTARSKAVEQVRSAAVRRKYEEAVALEKLSVQTRTDAARVEEFVGGLGEELREPLVLHFLRGLSQEQVAAELQLSQPTVSRRIERAIELLRSRLQTAGITAAPAVVLASPPFTGDALVAGEIAQRVVAVVNSVQSASAAAVSGAGGAAKTSLTVKAVAAGLLLTGVGTVIIAALEAGKSNPPAATGNPPAPAVAVSQPAAVPAPAGNWTIDGQKATIEGLGTVELVGICSDETDPPTWWGPDGKKLEVVPFTRSGINLSDSWHGRMSRRFAVRLSGPAATRMYFWEFQPLNGSRWTGRPPLNGFLPQLDVKEAEAGFAPGTSTVTVRYGIASPKLETLLETDRRGKVVSGGEHVRVTRVWQQGQNTIANFTVDAATDPGVVVTTFAVTMDGRWLEHINSNRNPHGPVDYEQMLPVPQDQLKKIVVQCRRYAHWVVWKDVPLQPGTANVITNVEQTAVLDAK